MGVRIIFHTKHLLDNGGGPRCIAVVQILCNGQNFYMLEVDTSDAAKSISTKLLIINEPAKLEEHVNEIERLLVKNSLCWPTTFLDKICGLKRHKGIPHPKTDSLNKGLLDPESINKWAQRVQSWMLSI